MGGIGGYFWVEELNSCQVTSVEQHCVCSNVTEEVIRLYFVHGKNFWSSQGICIPK